MLNFVVPPLAGMYVKRQHLLMLKYMLNVLTLGNITVFSVKYAIFST